MRKIIHKSHTVFFLFYCQRNWEREKKMQQIRVGSMLVDGNETSTRIKVI